MRTGPTGTIHVRVALDVEVDPVAWAKYMMDRYPDETLQVEVRRDVKKRIRNRIADWPMAQSDYDADVEVPIGDVGLENA